MWAGVSTSGRRRDLDQVRGHGVSLIPVLRRQTIPLRQPLMMRRGAVPRSGLRGLAGSGDLRTTRPGYPTARALKCSTRLARCAWISGCEMGHQPTPSCRSAQLAPLGRTKVYPSLLPPRAAQNQASRRSPSENGELPCRGSRGERRAARGQGRLLLASRSSGRQAELRRTATIAEHPEPDDRHPDYPSGSPSAAKLLPFASGRALAEDLPHDRKHDHPARLAMYRRMPHRQAHRQSVIRNGSGSVITCGSFGGIVIVSFTVRPHRRCGIGMVPSHSLPENVGVVRRLRPSQQSPYQEASQPLGFGESSFSLGGGVFPPEVVIVFLPQESQYGVASPSLRVGESRLWLGSSTVAEPTREIRFSWSQCTGPSVACIVCTMNTPWVDHVWQGSCGVWERRGSYFVFDVIRRGTLARETGDGVRLDHGVLDAELGEVVITSVAARQKFPAPALTSGDRHSARPSHHA